MDEQNYKQMNRFQSIKAFYDKFPDKTNLPAFLDVRFYYPNLASAIDREGLTKGKDRICSANRKGKFIEKLSEKDFLDFVRNMYFGKTPSYIGRQDPTVYHRLNLDRGEMQSFMNQLLEDGVLINGDKSHLNHISKSNCWRNLNGGIKKGANRKYAAVYDGC